MDYFDKSTIISLTTKELALIVSVENKKYTDDAITCAKEELIRRDMMTCTGELCDEARAKISEHISEEKFFREHGMTEKQVSFFEKFPVLYLGYCIFNDDKELYRNNRFAKAFYLTLRFGILILLSNLLFEIFRSFAK